MPVILVVEDDISFSMMLKTFLTRKQFNVTTVQTVSKAKDALKDKQYDLVLSDMRLPDGEGTELLAWMHAENKTSPFIVMTSYAEIQSAVSAIKQGASDYISKPLNPEELLQKITELTSPNASTTKSTPTAAKKKETPNRCIEGQSPQAKQLFEHVKLVAPTDMAVLIQGASGSGKEYVASRMHALSNRSQAAFVAVDCGAIPKELAASEFFGHIKGSFTGAVGDKEGALAAADGGTLFLDEIGNLSYEVQVQLLRALQEKKIKPIGSNQERSIDIRLVAATNENLPEAIAKGNFREDLYHRINEFSIHIPALKERKEDLPLFLNHFLDQANSELHKDVIGFDNETLQFLQTYSWPGNLRQMRNSVKYATLLATEPYITLKNLPNELLAQSTIQPTRSLLKDEQHERRIIEQALEQTNGNKSKTAQLLGIDRKTLYTKLKAFEENKG